MSIFSTALMDISTTDALATSAAVYNYTIKKSPLYQATTPGRACVLWNLSNGGWGTQKGTWIEKWTNSVQDNPMAYPNFSKRETPPFCVSKCQGQITKSPTLYTCQLA